LRAANKGSHKLGEELRAERERRERLEWQMQQLQQRPAAAEPALPNDDEVDAALAEELSNAVLDADKPRIARVLRQTRERAQRGSEQSFKNMLGQATAISQQQQSFGAYLADLGIKTGTPLHTRAMAIQNEMRNDPKYSFTAGNPVFIASLAAERARAEMGAERTTALTTLRGDAAMAAGSESGATGSGAPPGKKPGGAGKIYLTPAEKEAAEKCFGGGAEAAHKKYWENLDPWKREERTSRGRAMV
jgi:hypothetical protein